MHQVSLGLFREIDFALFLWQERLLYNYYVVVTITRGLRSVMDSVLVCQAKDPEFAPH